MRYVTTMRISMRARLERHVQVRWNRNGLKASAYTNDMEIMLPLDGQAIFNLSMTGLRAGSRTPFTLS